MSWNSFADWSGLELTEILLPLLGLKAIATIVQLAGVGLINFSNAWATDELTDIVVSCQVEKLGFKPSLLASKRNPCNDTLRLWPRHLTWCSGLLL